MKSLVAALQFLTICPLVVRIPCDERQIGRSAVWFPLIGLLVGGLLALLDHAALILFGPLIASVLSIIGLVAVSGGLHADGLADTADGFLSARTKDRILEIMRDSRIGAMGVLAIIATFALKCVALASVPPDHRWQILLLMGLAGRCSMTMQLTLLPYARSAGGLCSLFLAHRRPADAWLACLALLVGCGWILGSPQDGLLLACACGATLLAFCLWCLKKIGGLTGDTLGAGCEILELIPALFGASCWSLR